MPDILLQSGIYCYCGDTYDRYGPTKCNTPCSGDHSQICGDNWGITVYSGAHLIVFLLFSVKYYSLFIGFLLLC